MRYIRLLRSFVVIALQNMMAYQVDFWISLFHSVLNLTTGVLGLVVVFSQVEAIHGWTLGSSLALLGTYLTLSALRRLFVGPSLEALAGMDGEIWTGQFDFTLLRPIDTQFLASFRYWRPLALLDLMLGLVIVVWSAVKPDHVVTLTDTLAFFVALSSALAILYAILLAFSALIFWSPGFLFTWLFNAFFQMARYPIGFYPGWLRFVLTWVVPVGLMTTIPAQALSGTLPLRLLFATVAFAVVAVVGASVLFRTGLRRYASASS